jgi:leucyl-tRNA---protein transferase
MPISGLTIIGIKFDEAYTKEWAMCLTPTAWEELVLSAWERVGMNFFRRQYRLRYVTAAMEYQMNQVMPLRFRLTPDFQFSKSQQIIKKRNADLQIAFRPAVINDEKLAMFATWYDERFSREADIWNWVGSPSSFVLMELSVYKKGKLVACSFFDVTPNLQYSVMAMYDPTESKRSLGIFTLLCEIEYAILHQKSYHSPGYAWHAREYDYKKRFYNTETFDWAQEKWIAQARLDT